MNVFGKAFIGNCPGHKATASEVLKWKTSENAKWAYENLWSNVKDHDVNNDPHDTYINRITREVLKTNERTADNCLFVVSIVDLMFDPQVQSTVISGELITKRMTDKANEQQEIESGDNHDDVDDQNDHESLNV